MAHNLPQMKELEVVLGEKDGTGPCHACDTASVMVQT